MTKYFIDEAGSYIGGFDGTDPPPGSIEIAAPPPHGWMVRNMESGVWSMPAEKQAALDAAEMKIGTAP